jgi:hypothetical protein
MAKVQITIEDVEGKDDAVSMDYNFNPELPKESNEENESIPLTAAQTMAMNMFYFVKQMTKEKDDEGGQEGEEKAALENQEETCCGGGSCNAA